MSATQPKSLREPGPDHPIDIRPAPKRVVVRAGGRVVADSRAALSLVEASYPAVLYIPRDDVDMSLLAPVTRTSFCPYKGDCSYFGLADARPDAQPLAWSYESPGTKGTMAIAGHIAFYTDRVDSLEEVA
ncbi:MAG: hypothetical protein JWN07_3004 [Hyphomicrobiales bacterium]|nr:hypothetical protein [Hyphomicrobiales bacterium]